MKPNLLTKACWVLFFIFSLFTSPLQAQRFEWAKGYASSQEGNRIVGQVTDSIGNLYILGYFRNDASWDGGSHLLPIAPYGPYFDVNNVLIAKITPDGEMAWKKVIHCNNGTNSIAHDIKLVGDTAFACLVTFSLPTNDNYCYYLDTLLTGASDYPVPRENMMDAYRTALITFNFEGNVLEQHFLSLTYLDSNGHDIMENYPPPITPSEWYWSKGLIEMASFDIDAVGNIFLCRETMDIVHGIYGTCYGNISSIKYWVDGYVVGQSEVRNKPLRWYPQILKFSPHMDSLQGSCYLVQRSDSVEYQTNNLYLRLDSEGNSYVLGTLIMTGDNNNTIIIDSSQIISFSHTAVNHTVPYLVRYNQSLVANWCIYLEDSIINPGMGMSNNAFHDICFDLDSGMFFLIASTGRGVFTDTINFYSILKCQGIPLLGLRNDGFIMCFKNHDNRPNLHSYGRVPAKMTSSFISNSHGNLIAKNNYIFTQARYYGGIRLPEQNVILPSYGDCSLALTVFDYMCNIIDGENFMSLSQNNRPGPISMHDSILYLSSTLVSDATFGDIHVPAQGSCALIAKYVDASFMTPYEPPTVHITQADTTTVRLYPNPFGQKVNLECDGQAVRTAWLTDLTGRREEVRLQAAGPGRYVLDLTGRPQATYLLTLVTADGQERTLRLLKQQDMFGE